MSGKIGEYTIEYLKENLYSGLVCDVLDSMGYRNQFLGREMDALFPDTVVVGRAFTCIATEVYSMPEDPLTAQCRCIDQMKEDDVMVLTTRGNYSCAILGELMSLAILQKGGVGAVLDGMARDLKVVREMNFPLIYRGHLPSSSKGRAEVNECLVPIQIDGVTINPGDIVFGDIDGTVIIPQEIFDEVIKRAFEIEERENQTRDSIRSGASLESTYMKIGAI
ncbi:MAG: RraA family protein [Lachnospiraceae bacterium]|nr:RraA family protein [Lachnospiraceae bacterium]